MPQFQFSNRSPYGEALSCSAQASFWRQEDFGFQPVDGAGIAIVPPRSDNLRHDGYPIWIISDQSWHTDVAGARVTSYVDIPRFHPCVAENYFTLKGKHYLPETKDNWMREVL